MSSFENDLRFGIIKEDGSMDMVFSANDTSCKNLVKLSSNEKVDYISDFYETIKEETYQKHDNNDKHLFYLKQYLKNNFNQEFEQLGVNPQLIQDDLLLYYYLSCLNNVILINSSEHMNIIVTPNNGINGCQFQRLNDIQNLFTYESTTWSLANNMHIETFQEDGKTYGMLNIGETHDGNLKSVISVLEVKNSKQK